MVLRFLGQLVQARADRRAKIGHLQVRPRLADVAPVTVLREPGQQLVERALGSAAMRCRRISSAQFTTIRSTQVENRASPRN